MFLYIYEVTDEYDKIIYEYQIKYIIIYDNIIFIDYNTPNI